MKAKYLMPVLVFAASCGQVDTASDSSAAVQEMGVADASRAELPGSEHMDPQTPTGGEVLTVLREAAPVPRAAQTPPALDLRKAEAVRLPFQRIDRGIEFFDDEIMLGVRSARLTLVRISTEAARLSLAASDGPKDPGYSLLGYQKTRDARVVLSGGFLASFYPPLAIGFVKSDGVERNRPHDDRLLNGMLAIAGGRVEITAFHYDDGIETWQHVLQSGPLLVIDGRSALPDVDRIADQTIRNVIEEVYARTFIAIDARGRVLLGWLDGATLTDVVSLLTTPAAGLECRSALNLSGHRNAGLLVAAGGMYLEIGDTETRLPNALVVY